MKNLFLLAACLLFFVAANAQTSPTSHNQGTAKQGTSKQSTSKTTKAAPKDCCKMSGGMMLVVKNGFTTTMSQDLMLKNGTLIHPDGSILTKAGKRFNLKEGYYVDMKGKMAKF